MFVAPQQVHFHESGSAVEAAKVVSIGRAAGRAGGGCGEEELKNRTAAGSENGDFGAMEAAGYSGRYGMRAGVIKTGGGGDAGIEKGAGRLAPEATNEFRASRALRPLSNSLGPSSTSLSFSVLSSSLSAWFWSMSSLRTGRTFSKGHSAECPARDERGPCHGQRTSAAVHATTVRGH